MTNTQLHVSRYVSVFAIALCAQLQSVVAQQNVHTTTDGIPSTASRDIDTSARITDTLSLPDSVHPKWKLILGGGTMTTSARYLRTTAVVNATLQLPTKSKHTVFDITVQASQMGTDKREEERPWGTMLVGSLRALFSLVGSHTGPTIELGVGVSGMVYKYIQPGLLSSYVGFKSSEQSSTFGTTVSIDCALATFGNIQPWARLQVISSLIKRSEIQEMYVAVLGVRWISF